jgi:hypothetical protein
MMRQHLNLVCNHLNLANKRVSIRTYRFKETPYGLAHRSQRAT